MDRFVAAVQAKLPDVALDRRDDELADLGQQACAGLAAGKKDSAVARDLAGPGVTGPGVTGPGVTGPGVTGPGVTGPGVTGPGVTGPGVTGPGVTGVDARALVALAKGTACRD